MNSAALEKRVERTLSILLVLAGLWIGRDLITVFGRLELPYSEFKASVARGAITRVVVSPQVINGEFENGTKFRTQRVDGDTTLYSSLDAKEIPYEALPIYHRAFYDYVVPLLLLASFGLAFYQRTRRPLKAFGGRGASLLVAEKPNVTFAMIAGCEEAKEDLAELVEYLRTPQRYTSMGASIPRGVLLSGPPGTGKTLLAKALAAEAHVPFFSLSGSEFVEMYVGVGAARIRALFQQARREAPCIVFIDELDALGKSRDSQGGGNDEREHTLNQLLVELDGFNKEDLVILVGATNRPDIIDPALMRPGRFDRQVTVDAPDREGRLSVLKVHTRNRKLCPQTSLQTLADATSGMSGAELANIVNEGAILAARENAECISNLHLREAMERVLAGPVRSGRLLSPSLKKRIAYHEVGHALVAHYSPSADPVHKISIVPRGKAALGYTLQLPSGDTYLMTESELKDRVRVLLAGRAAEKLVFDEVSTGAENDLVRANEIVRRMVGHFGMSKQSGLVHYGSNFQGCSPAASADLDQEVREILWALYDDACSILERHREKLDRVAIRLLEVEVIEADEFEEML